jgi:hypothetical protein
VAACIDVCLDSAWLRADMSRARSWRRAPYLPQADTPHSMTTACPILHQELGLASNDVSAVGAARLAAAIQHGALPRLGRLDLQVRVLFRCAYLLCLHPCLLVLSGSRTCTMALKPSLTHPNKKHTHRATASAARAPGSSPPPLERCVSHVHAASCTIHTHHSPFSQLLVVFVT